MTDAAELIEENAQLKSQIKYMGAQIKQLEELLQLFKRRQFSSSSEKASPDQIALFNEGDDDSEKESEETKTESNPLEENQTKTHSFKKKPRVSIPKHYPREDIIYDLPEEEKICPNDGTTLKMIGHEDHEQLDIIPAQIKVLRHRRLTYACPCCEQHIVTANKPKQPIPKSVASPGLLAQIAIQKYCDALPLYRQSQIYQRLGIQLDRTNLANWMIRCGELVQPLINLMRDQLQKALCVHMDETVVQVLHEAGRVAESKSYMWVMVSQGDKPVRLFHYDPTRSQSVPLSLLTPETQAIMVDGYEGYQASCDQYQITRLGCMAHARRKFIDAQKLQKKGKTGKADQAIAYIQKLYCIEKKIKDLPHDERYRIRKAQSKPIIDKMREWLEKSLPTVPPKTALGKALNYLHNQWDRLVRYLENGSYPIDNNAAENAVRPFVIGRKNWLFSASESGAKSSANLYGLIETAKANQLNIHDYLQHIFKELPNAESVEQIEKMLPWNIQLG